MDKSYEILGSQSRETPMFVITAVLTSNNQRRDLWFGSNRRTAERALSRLRNELRSVYAQYEIVERDRPQ